MKSKAVSIFVIGFLIILALTGIVFALYFKKQNDRMAAELVRQKQEEQQKEVEAQKQLAAQQDLKKQADERKQKFGLLQSNLSLAHSGYEASFRQMGHWLQEVAKTAHENAIDHPEFAANEDDAIRDAFKFSNITNLINVASDAADYSNKGKEIFEVIYTTYKDVPESLKIDFIDYQTIINDNANFIQNAQSGNISTEGAKEWVNNDTKEATLYQNITLEVERLEK